MGTFTILSLYFSLLFIDNESISPIIASGIYPLFISISAAPSHAIIEFILLNNFKGIEWFGKSPFATINKGFFRNFYIPCISICPKQG